MKRFTLCAVVLIAIAGKGTSSQTPLETPRAWGSSVDGLRLGLSGMGAAPTSGAGFIVALQNTGASDLVVNLGSFLGNGEMFGSAVRLTLTDPLGSTRDLKFFNRRAPGVAGWVGDFTVGLRAGAVYAFPISLDQYWSEETLEFELKLTPGRHRISARFEGNEPRRARPDIPPTTSWPWPYWKGTVRSNTLDFEAMP